MSPIYCAGWGLGWSGGDWVVQLQSQVLSSFEILIFLFIMDFFALILIFKNSALKYYVSWLLEFFWHPLKFCAQKWESHLPHPSPSPGRWVLDNHFLHIQKWWVLYHRAQTFLSFVSVLCFLVVGMSLQSPCALFSFLLLWRPAVL